MSELEEILENRARAKETALEMQQRGVPLAELEVVNIALGQVRASLDATINLLRRTFPGAVGKLVSAREAIEPHCRRAHAAYNERNIELQRAAVRYWGRIQEAERTVLEDKLEEVTGTPCRARGDKAHPLVIFALTRRIDQIRAENPDRSLGDTESSHRQSTVVRPHPHPTTDRPQDQPTDPVDWAYPEIDLQEVVRFAKQCQQMHPSRDLGDPRPERGKGTGGPQVEPK